MTIITCKKKPFVSLCKQKPRKITCTYHPALEKRRVQSNNIGRLCKHATVKCANSSIDVSSITCKCHVQFQRANEASRGNEDDCHHSW